MRCFLSRVMIWMRYYPHKLLYFNNETFRVGNFLEEVCHWVGGLWESLAWESISLGEGFESLQLEEVYYWGGALRISNLRKCVTGGGGGRVLRIPRLNKSVTGGRLWESTTLSHFQTVVWTFSVMLPSRLPALNVYPAAFSPITGFSLCIQRSK